MNRSLPPLRRLLLPVFLAAAASALALSGARAMLALEQAQARVAARGLPAEPARGPRFAGELQRAAGGVLAVVPTARGVQVSKLREPAAGILAGLDGTRTCEELECLHPGIGAALERFREAGLLS